MKNSFYYITKYPLNLCLDYMKHRNINDTFVYCWEEKGDYYLITFKEYNGILSLANAPKPTFKVVFEDLGNETGIQVQFISDIFQPVPSVYTKNIHEFWEKKLEAKIKE